MSTIIVIKGDTRKLVDASYGTLGKLQEAIGRS